MENVCPCCENHCPPDHLRCRRGKEYFGKAEGAPNRPQQPEEKTVLLLRKCGHFLHHSAGGDGQSASLQNALSPEERETLENLLEKCLNYWQNSAK